MWVARQTDDTYGIKFSHDDSDGLMTVSGDLTIAAAYRVQMNKVLQLGEIDGGASFNELYSNSSGDLVLQTDSGTNSIILAGDGAIRVQTKTGNDLYLESDDDLYIIADSDVRIEVGNGTNDYVWKFDYQGYLLYPALATDPADTSLGGVYFNTVDDTLRVCDGTNWNSLAYVG